VTTTLAPAGTHAPSPVPAGYGRKAVDAEYVATVRDVTDMALALGHPELVIGPVRQTALWEPLDESVLTRLLLVLAASGRQAEASTTYSAIHSRLADGWRSRRGPGARLPARCGCRPAASSRRP
jgi:hypothetical protein